MTTDISTLLQNLTQSLTSTTSNFPSPALSNPNGISLLDLKNDVFLSYLHHLSFLILCRVRGVQLIGDSEEDAVGSAVVEKLAELRTWLEKGVKPAETKLKYQIDKVLRAARDHEREEERRKRREVMLSDDENNSSDDEQGGKQAATDDSVFSGLPTTIDYDSDNTHPAAKSKSRMAATSTTSTTNSLTYRPNPSLLTKPTSSGLISLSNTTNDNKKTNGDGIYRPPKITPMSLPDLPLPSTSDINNDPDARSSRSNRAEKQQRSHAIDDFIASEYSSAPLPQPSIGSTITDYGRKTTTAQEREKDFERRNYEESNFLRLPKLSKKEAAQEKKSAGGRDGGWGGEDWRGVTRGLGLDRIEKLTQRKGGRENMLDRSRKREFGDGGGGDSGSMGDRFEKRRKVLDGKRRK